jgi:hypothetical protein
MKANTGNLKGRGVHNKYKSLWAKHYEKTLKTTWTSLNLGNIFTTTIDLCLDSKNL